MWAPIAISKAMVVIVDLLSEILKDTDCLSREGWAQPFAHFS